MFEKEAQNGFVKLQRIKGVEIQYVENNEF